MAILGAMLKGGLALGKGAATGGFAARTAIGAGVGAVGGFAGSDFENPNLMIGGVMRGAAIGAFAGGALGLNKSIGRMMAPAGKSAWKYTPTSMIAKDVARGITGQRGAQEGFFAWNTRIGEERLRKFFGDTMGTEAFIQQNRSAVMRHSPVAQTIAAPMNIAGAAIKHPFATAGVVGGGFLGYAHLTRPDSPTLRGDVEAAQRGLNATTRVNYDTQALAAESLRESGVAPMGSLGTVPQMMGPMQRAFQNSTSGLVQGLHRSRH